MLLIFHLKELLGETKKSGVDLSFKKELESLEKHNDIVASPMDKGVGLSFWTENHIRRNCIEFCRTQEPMLCCPIIQLIYLRRS